MANFSKLCEMEEVIFDHVSCTPIHHILSKGTPILCHLNVREDTTSSM